MNDGHHHDRERDRELGRQIERLNRQIEERKRETERHIENMRRQVEDTIRRPEYFGRHPAEEKLSGRPGSDFRPQQPEFGPAQFPSTGTLNIDLLDQEEELILRAAVPGFSKEEINVSLVDDVVQIEATHEESEERDEGQYVMRERPQSMSRTVALGTPIAEDEEILAHYENGLVTIRLPKAEPSEDEATREIDIE